MTTNRPGAIPDATWAIAQRVCTPGELQTLELDALGCSQRTISAHLQHQPIHRTVPPRERRPEDQPRPEGERSMTDDRAITALRNIAAGHLPTKTTGITQDYIDGKLANVAYTIQLTAREYARTVLQEIDRDN